MAILGGGERGLLQQQAWAFLTAMLTGIIAGILFDIYRVLRQLLGLRKIGTAVGDFISLISISLAAFSLLLLGNWGEMRLFVILAIAGGLIIYFKVASFWTQRAVYFTIKALGWGAKALLQCILIPCRIILRILRVPVQGLGWASHLTARILEYLLSFLQAPFCGWYRRVLNKFSHPPRP